MIWLLAVAILALLYPYVIFPALMALISGLPRKNRAVPDARLPRIAILISAYNEAGHILDKLANFKEMDYPAGRLRMWIGTDGSEDGTAGIIRQANVPGVTLVERFSRGGKTAVLNDLASRARAEETDLFVFSDVNAFFLPGTLRLLAAPFVDEPQTGLVSGRSLMRGDNGQVVVEGSYYRFETWLKERQSRRGWLAGAFGPIYAMRANLYRELNPALINDLTHPCQVSALGYDCRFLPEAVAEESAGDDAGREFSRQTRMTAQASYVLLTQMPALFPAGRWGQIWVLISHKWMRWTAGLWIIAGFIALAATSPPLAALALAGLLILLLGWRAKANWASLPCYFLLVHTAYLNGLLQAIRGNRFVVWKPRAG